MSTDTPQIVTVDVPRDVAREAARIADEENVAMEDALAHLTAFDYPTDVVAQPAGTTCKGTGP